MVASALSRAYDFFLFFCPSESSTRGRKLFVVLFLPHRRRRYVAFTRRTRTHTHTQGLFRKSLIVVYEVIYIMGTPNCGGRQASVQLSDFQHCYCVLLRPMVTYCIYSEMISWANDTLYYSSIFNGFFILEYFSVSTYQLPSTSDLLTILSHILVSYHTSKCSRCRIQL